MKRGVFPGSFDPFTKGHEAIVNKAITLFDEVIISVGVNTSKTSMYTLEKRLKHIQSSFPESSKIKVITFEKLTIELCQELDARFIIRGLRDSKDFEYEKSIALMNHSLAQIDTVFLLTSLEYSAISSSIIREIAKNKGDISQFVTNSHLLV
jgi:pantetheine-phosphate adenylyltransferase